MVDMTDAELDAILASIDAAEETPSALYDLDLDAIKSAITTLRTRIAELEADRAEWVEVDRLRMGKVSPAQTPPQE